MTIFAKQGSFSALQEGSLPVACKDHPFFTPLQPGFAGSSRRGSSQTPSSPLSRFLSSALFFPSPFPFPSPPLPIDQSLRPAELGAEQALQQQQQEEEDGGTAGHGIPSAATPPTPSCPARPGIRLGFVPPFVSAAVGEQAAGLPAAAPADAAAPAAAPVKPAAPGPGEPPGRAGHGAPADPAPR